jgi:hypothetical protein
MSIFYYLSKKCEILFKNLLLNLLFFIFCKIKFFKNLVFLTDTVADLAVCYTLCRRYTLCAHSTHEGASANLALTYRKLITVLIKGKTLLSKVSEISRLSISLLFA